MIGSNPLNFWQKRQVQTYSGEETLSHNLVLLGSAMTRTILLTALLVTLLNPAWGKATTKLPLGRSPCSVFIAGPGTIVSVDQLDLPFIEPHYAVKYKTDSGELIEVWTPATGIVLSEGMHGELTYSTHPERILNFRPVSRKDRPKESVLAPDKELTKPDTKR
jgi:hypothetical protein